MIPVGEIVGQATAEGWQSDQYAFEFVQHDPAGQHTGPTLEKHVLHQHYNKLYFLKKIFYLHS